MTDQIEALLALLPEEEDREEVLEGWGAGGAAPAAPAGVTEKAPEKGAGSGEGSGMAFIQTQAGGRKNGPEIPGRAGLRRTATAPEGQKRRMVWTEEASDGGGMARRGTSLTARVRRMGAAVDYAGRRPAERALAPEGTGGGGPGLTAGELDRMLERDARRYDGGFSLY